MATRSRKGCRRMSSNSIVQRALTNRRLHDQGFPACARYGLFFTTGRNPACSSEPHGAAPHAGWCGARGLACWARSARSRFVAVFLT